MAYVHFDILRKGNALYPNAVILSQVRKEARGMMQSNHLPFWLEHAEPGYSNVLCL